MPRPRRPEPPQAERSLEEAAVLENEAWLQDANVAAVGFGLKIRGGLPQPEAALHYYVYRKLGKEGEIARAGSQMIPEDRHGYQTDVIELELARAHQDHAPPTGARGGRKENPLVGGTSTTALSSLHSFPTGFGTLGGICFDAMDGSAMAMSNAHVWGSTTGLDVIQPWMPVDEYLEAAAKLLLCGPAAFIVDTTVPSPLTAGLAAAAAAAFAAAAASDAEDPHRWGQRVTGAPGGGATTSAEVVNLAANVPETPFAGIAYTVETDWRYERQTSGGTLNDRIAEERPNEHLLVGKRVWTDRTEYGAGDRIDVCAEITVPDPKRHAGDFFVVATLHSLPDATQAMRRVLVPGQCGVAQRRTKDVCFRGFGPPAKPGGSAAFPLTEGAYTLYSSASSRFVPPAGGSTLPILDLSSRDSVLVSFTPATRVRVRVIQGAGPRVTVAARNSAGVVVATASSTGANPNGETLTLEADEIVAVRIFTKGERNALVGVCSSRGKPTHQPDGKKFPRFTYTGSVDLDLRAQRGEWGVMLSVQSVNTYPPDADPSESAPHLGGITTSANMANLGGCVIIELLDHVFNVI